MFMVVNLKPPLPVAVVPSLVFLIVHAVLLAEGLHLRRGKADEFRKLSRVQNRVFAEVVQLGLNAVTYYRQDSRNVGEGDCRAQCVALEQAVQEVQVLFEELLADVLPQLVKELFFIPGVPVLAVHVDFNHVQLVQV